MKEMSKIKKILLSLIIAIIIGGIVVSILYGFNKSISYQKSTKIEINIPNGYEKSDIKQIANEVFEDKDIQIQDIEKTGQVVSVRIKDYTEDELNEFKSKISEKYGIDVNKLTAYEVEIPETSISTIVKPYIFPVGLVTSLSVVYITLRNIKNDAIKKVIKLILSLVIVAGLYFSIFAITRLQINEYTMPIALALYVATLLISIIKIEKE